MPLLVKYHTLFSNLTKGTVRSDIAYLLSFIMVAALGSCLKGSLVLYHTGTKSVDTKLPESVCGVFWEGFHR